MFCQDRGSWRERSKGLGGVAGHCASRMLVYVIWIGEKSRGRGADIKHNKRLFILNSKINILSVLGLQVPHRSHGDLHKAKNSRKNTKCYQWLNKKEGLWAYSLDGRALIDV